MRLAILGSIALAVPPPAQGGTEWIAYYQAKGLAERSHEIILFAARGSQKDKYRLIEIGKGDTVVGSSKNLLSDASFVESSRSLRKETVYLADVVDNLINNKDHYDIVLNNMRGEAIFIPIIKTLAKKFVTVLHLPLFPELADFLKKYNTAIISISNAQRKEFPQLNYLATVYNGCDTDKFVFNQHPSDYLLMMATIGTHKNQKGAINVAKKLGMKLILAGKIRDNDYFEELKKEIDGQQIQYFGELSFDKKLTLYQNAKAFIFPILWEEPFGLVMIEAMSCGTPVVAFDNGAVPEVVVNGKTGFVIENNSEENMAEAIKKIDNIKREDCRHHVDQNFSIEKMVDDYESALLQITGNK